MRLRKTILSSEYIKQFEMTSNLKKLLDNKWVKLITFFKTWARKKREYYNQKGNAMKLFSKENVINLVI